ncbi:MAG: DUF4912 domain-containing protein [Planctomycetota bacterium]
MPTAKPSAADLRSRTRKDLARLAKSAGVAGWHGMKKEELISALTSVKTAAKPSVAPRSAERRTTPKTNGSATGRRPAAAPRPTASQRKLAALHSQKRRLRDISTGEATTQDRLLMLIRDPYWLHLSWEVSPESVRRAETALAQQWHAAQPTLRIHRLHPSGASGSYKQQAIHGGVNHWYIDVSNPPGRYRAEIGYASTSGEFYCICKSNEASTPEAGPASHENWTDIARNADRIYAMSGGYSPDGVSSELREALEERLQRRLGRPTDTRLASSANTSIAAEPLVAVEAEMVVHGEVAPHTHLTVKGEPVEVADDHTFRVRLPMPDRRQVVPIVASSADGARQKTVIVGVDKNTKTLAQPRASNGSG